jgi:hypothetical protein
MLQYIENNLVEVLAFFATFWSIFHSFCRIFACSVDFWLTKKAHFAIMFVL